MKVLIIGDPHFRLELPYAAAFEDGRRGEWDSVVSTIHEAAKRADAVVLMGDNLNSRHNHSTVIKDFVEFLKGFNDRNVHILVGNHERYGSSTALDFLEKMGHSSWHVYSTPHQNVDIGGVKASFIPFMIPWMINGSGDLQEDTKAFLDTLQPADVAFFHQGITGAKTQGTMVDLFNEMVFPREHLEGLYKKVFSGHVHQPQKVGDVIQMTGSMFTMEAGEHGKDVYIYDTSTNETEVIPLPVRGIYHIENDEAVAAIPDSSIVKCTVSDKKINVEQRQEELARFNSSVVIERYPDERHKVRLEDSGKLELDILSLLQLYAKSRDLSYNSLKEGFDLLKEYESNRA